MMNFFRRRKSFELNPDNPTYKVSYLGNVATGSARPTATATTTSSKELLTLPTTFTSKPSATYGTTCSSRAAAGDDIIRPLNRLWAAHLVRPGRISMQLTVCNDGLKVVTEQYGLVEYWAHRITFCGVHPDFPNVFIWVYRHDGKNLKPDLRFHGALCAKHEKADRIAQQLQLKLREALLEFKREKLSKQRSRIRHDSLTQKCAEFSDVFIHNNEQQQQHSTTSSIKPKSNNRHAATFNHSMSLPSSEGHDVLDGAEFFSNTSTARSTTKHDDSNNGSPHNSTLPNRLSSSPVSDYSSCTITSGGIQPKRKDLKSCSKNYKPNVSQIGLPKLHSIDEEVENFMPPPTTAAAAAPADERYNQLKPAVLLNNEKKLKSCLRSLRDYDYTSCRAAGALPQQPLSQNNSDIIHRHQQYADDVDDDDTLLSRGDKDLQSKITAEEAKAKAPDQSSSGSSSSSGKNASSCSTSSASSSSKVDNNVAEDAAELSDDGVFCKTSNSSRESDCMQYFGSNASSSASSSSQMSASSHDHIAVVVDEDDDGDDVDHQHSSLFADSKHHQLYNAAAPRTTNNNNVSELYSCSLSDHDNDEIIVEAEEEGQCISSPLSASDTERHTPMPLFTDDEKNHQNSCGLVTESTQQQQLFCTKMLTKRLGQLAMADLQNSV